MCGIFGLLLNKFFIDETYTNEEIQEFYKYIFENFKDHNERGPDNSIIKYHENISSIIGFHRLAINGLNSESNQPIIINKKLLICNGEIYNYKNFYNKFNITPKTHSDCEAIIYMYEMFGIETTLHYIDGVFAFMLIDFTDLNNIRCFVARDPYGVRPLFEFQMDLNYDKNEEFKDYQNTSFGFASEMKYFYKLQNLQITSIKNIKQFKPGSYVEYQMGINSFSSSYINNNVEKMSWHKVNEKIYHNVHSICDITPYIPDYQLQSCDDYYTDSLYYDLEENIITTHIKLLLEQAVQKRVTTTDRPIACLLSGGLDSSLITSLVHRFYSSSERTLETYSIGMKGSEDLKYAKIVADFLGTKHTSIEVTEQEFLDEIPNIIKTIESYDTTTVRASVGNYLVSKYISLNSDAKVIFNGDGSDEVTGGYMYFHYAPNDVEFDNECKRLLENIHFFDVLRSDRSISNNGLEPRTPFLDKRFVQYYLSIPREIRFNTHKQFCEKYLLRKAFDDGTYLPKEVLWRTKEAFSDGVSSQSRSWYQIIQEHVEKFDYIKNIYENQYFYKIMFDELKKKFLNIPENEIKLTKEQIYYYLIYKKHYNHDEIKGITNKDIIPYYWMPNFIKATDASARTLQIYDNKTINKTQKLKEKINYKIKYNIHMEKID